MFQFDVNIIFDFEFYESFLQRYMAENLENEKNMLLRCINVEGLEQDIIKTLTLKYWVGVQRGQCYLTGRRYLFSLRWLPFY